MAVEATRAYGNPVHLRESRHLIQMVWNSQSMDSQCVIIGEKSIRKKKKSRRKPILSHQSIFLIIQARGHHGALDITWCLFSQAPGASRRWSPLYFARRDDQYQSGCLSTEPELGPSLLKPRSPEMTLTAAAVCSPGIASGADEILASFF